METGQGRGSKNPCPPSTKGREACHCPQAGEEEGLGLLQPLLPQAVGWGEVQTIAIVAVGGEGGMGAPGT